MKVLALGGAGDMGRMAIAILLESPKISSITVADISYEQANALVELVASDRLSAFQIDITEKEKLINLMNSHDIIISTVGPFYKFEKMIIEAAIKAKKPLLDICDDWKPTLEALELDENVKSADIPVIIGIGASPGITNLMAVLANSKFDDVYDIRTAWGFTQYLKTGKKPRYYVTGREMKKKIGHSRVNAWAAIEHLFYESIGKIPIYKEGKSVMIESLTEAKPIRFPGFKDTYACYIGHPESITLPRKIKAKNISNLMFIGVKLTETTREYRKKILNNELAITDAAMAWWKETKQLYKKPHRWREYFKMPPILCAIVTGMKNGRRKKIAIGLKHIPYAEMAGLTGIPLAIATLMLIEGKIKLKGVLTPEEAIDPTEFFDRFALYCGKNLSNKDILLIKEEDF